MRLLGLILGIVFFTANINAQDAKHLQDVKNNLNLQVNTMTEAFKIHDLNTWISFMHPNVLRYLAKDKILESTETYLADLDAAHSIIQTLTANELIDIINNDLNWQAILKQNLVILTQDGSNISSTAYLFAESIDNGKTWKFAEIKKDGSFKYLFKDCSPKLYIPNKEEYLIYR